MSGIRWRYSKACDDMPCPGDCEKCSFDPDAPQGEDLVAKFYKMGFLDGYKLAMQLAERDRENDRKGQGNQ